MIAVDMSHGGGGSERGRARHDDGYFPRGRSVLRRVHGERAVGLHYGQRGLLVGAANPLTYTGTMASTSAATSPFTRLARTAKVHETIFFDTRVEADRALAMVHRLHERVRGTLPEPAGRWPAGTPYSATDPPLMLWTLACIADSAAVLYETLVTPLSAREREALWQDYLLFGELFGLPRADAPGSWAEFRSYWRARLEGELFLTDDARVVAPQTAFRIPVPRHWWPNMRVSNLILMGSLPERIRELYGFSWGSAQAAAYQALAASSRRSGRLVPQLLRRGGNDVIFDTVARTEARRLAAGKPTLRRT
jgi:uncharacterized protein (DUF2236 family)